MAFTAQLSEPGNAGYVGQGSASGTGIVGGALSGLADILNVGLKASQEDRAKKVSGQIESTLAPMAADYGKPEQLIGQGNSPRSVLGPGYTGTMDRMAQAVQQNPGRRQEFLARASAEVQKAIAANPRFANEIRERAKDVLGFNPTSEMVAVQNKEADEQNAIDKAIKLDTIQSAVHNGLVHADANGQLDYNATSSAVADFNHSESQLELAHKMLENKIAQETLDKKAPLTDTEQKQIRQGNLLPYYTSIYDNVIAGAKSRLDAFIEANKGVGDPVEQSALLAGEMNQLKLGYKTWLTAQVHQAMSKGAATTADAEDFNKHFDTAFKDYADLIGQDGFSAAKNRILMADQLKANDSVWAHKAAPIITASRAVVGDQAIGNLIGPAINRMDADKNTNWTGDVVSELQNMGATQHVAAATAIADGRLTTHDIPGSKNQKDSLAIRLPMLDGYTANPNNLQPFELSAFGNLIKDQAKIVTGEADPDSARSGAIHIVNPSALATFDKYAKANPGQAKETGGWMLDASTNAFLVNARNLQPSVSPGSFNAKTGVKTDETTFTPVYNAATGRIEIENNYKSNNTNPYTVPTPSRELSATVKFLNDSLDATAHLKDYGNDQVRKMDELLWKGTLASGSGLAVKGNITPEEKKSETAPTANKPEEDTYDMHRVPGPLGDLIDQTSKAYGVDPALAHAFALEESSGGKDLKGDISVVGKASENPFQVGSDVAKQYNVNPQTPHGSTIAGIQHIKALSERYGHDLEKTAIAYIAGDKNVDKVLKDPLKFPHTITGVNRILKMMGKNDTTYEFEVTD